VINVKFNSLKGGWCSEEVSGSIGVGMWKHIRRGCEKFGNLVNFDVGDESHVSLWHDWWCGDRYFEAVFSNSI